jgi:chromosome segregation protein
MIFLRKFIANGFKSFAKNIEIDFQSSMVGVVGPNGSGKSNIVDAIK